VNSSDVVTAIVKGRVLREDRVLTSFDVAEVLAEVNQVAEKMAP
jgi:hypothetical protein